MAACALCKKGVCKNSLWLGAMAVSTCVLPTVVAATFLRGLRYGQLRARGTVGRGRQLYVVSAPKTLRFVLD